MTVTHRRLLYSLFFLVFFLAAPAVLLYSSGYRYDLLRHAFYKRALLVLEVEPKPDRVLVDDRPLHTFPPSPIRIDNLAPGIHTIRLESGGYAIWEKMLYLKAGEAATLEGVHLIRRNIPVTVAEHAAGIAIQPGHTNLFIFRHDGSPSLFSHDTKKETPLFNPGMPTIITKAQWAQSGAQVLVSDNTEQWYIVDTASPSAPVQKLALPVKAERVTWHPWKQGVVLFFVSNDLFSMATTQQTPSLVAMNISDWYAEKQTMYTIVTSQTETAVFRLDPATQTFSTVLALPNARLPRFAPSPENTLTILDQQTATLTTLALHTQPLKNRSYTNTNYAAWNSDGSALAYGNAIELNTAHDPFGENTIDTITRTGVPIQKALWVDATSYLFVQQQAALKIFETAFGSPHQVYALFGGRLQSAELTADGSNALIVLPDGTVQSINVF